MEFVFDCYFHSSPLFRSNISIHLSIGPPPPGAAKMFTIEYGPHSKNVRCALACAADALTTDSAMLPIRNSFFISSLDGCRSYRAPIRRGMPLQLPGDLAAVTTWSIVSAGYAASAPMCERTSVFVVTKRSCVCWSRKRHSQHGCSCQSKHHLTHSQSPPFFIYSSTR